MSAISNVIEHKDLIPFGTYKNGRDEYIRKMIAYKSARRIRLDDTLSVLFENKQTVLFQIQELIYSEDLTDSEEIDEYIDIYSGMLPSPNGLSATLFIEMDNQQQLEELLVKLKGIEQCLILDIGGESIQAVFEEEHNDREYTTSVHYLKFPLTESAKSYLTTTSPKEAHLQLILDHPAMNSVATLSPESIKSLAEDLDK